MTDVKCSRYVSYITIVILVSSYDYSKCSKTNVYVKESGAIALSYPPRVRVRATVKLSAAFFNDESSITIGGVRKCNSARRA